MELTHKNIEVYIARFMEGETTNAEEQAIYRYFRTSDVPEHLKPYAPMFAWYEEGMPEKEWITESEKPKKTNKTLWRSIPLEMWSMGIAAMLAVAIGLGAVLSFKGGKSDEWACYEGSYVKVDGKCITDVEKIMPIIQKTLSEVEAQERNIEAQLDEIRKIEEYVAEKEQMLANN